jgi:hypothetical protein
LLHPPLGKGWGGGVAASVSLERPRFAAMERLIESRIAPRAALPHGRRSHMGGPPTWAALAHERRSHMSGAPPKFIRGSPTSCGSRALAAMQRLIDSRIAPRAALPHGRPSHKIRPGLAGSLWEPRPRGDAAPDRQPNRAEGGAPTWAALPQNSPRARRQSVGAAPSRRCGA